MNRGKFLENNVVNGTLKAWFLSISLSGIFGALIWIAAQLGTSGTIDALENRMDRIDVLIEAHMEGHPRTVLQQLHEHVADWRAHQHIVDQPLPGAPGQYVPQGHRHGPMPGAAEERDAGE